MNFILNFSKPSLKGLEEINELFYSKIKTAITALVNNPRPNGCKKLKGREGYRIRISDYARLSISFSMQSSLYML
jgi:mRNA interferase RelE/StbE